MSTPAIRSKPTVPLEVKGIGQLVRKAESEGAPSGKPVFRVTAAKLDRHKDRMLHTAIKVDSFELNPVVLWNHDSWEPAIGTARIYEENGEWLAEVTFSEVTERAREVKALVDESTLRTCSLGFIVHDYELNDAGGYDYLLVEVVELSITNIPAVREAQRVKNQKGKSGQTPEAETPADEVKAKALEEGDAETIRAIVAEEVGKAVAPLAEAIARLEAKLGEGAAEEKAEEEAAPAEEVESAEPAEEKRAGGVVIRGFLFGN